MSNYAIADGAGLETKARGKPLQTMYGRSARRRQIPNIKKPIATKNRATATEPDGSAPVNDGRVGPTEVVVGIVVLLVVARVVLDAGVLDALVEACVEAAEDLDDDATKDELWDDELWDDELWDDELWDDELWDDPNVVVVWAED